MPKAINAFKPASRTGAACLMTVSCKAKNSQPSRCGPTELTIDFSNISKTTARFKNLYRYAVHMMY
jgi:hypothetical protein